MALTRKEYIGNGSTTLYNVDFDLGYIDEDYVFVYLEGNEYTNQLDYTWQNSTQIELNTPVSTGVKFYIRRVIPRNALINDYTNGALLREGNLNNSYKQVLMIMQEIQDGFITVDDEFLILAKFVIVQNLDMAGYKIENLQEAVGDTDATTLAQVKNLINLASNLDGYTAQLIDYLNLEILQSPTDGLTKIKTRTLLDNEVYEVRKVSDNSLATIYSDKEGDNEIDQNGTDNVSGSGGVVVFYVREGSYYIKVGVTESEFISLGRNPDTVEKLKGYNVDAGSTLKTYGYYDGWAGEVQNSSGTYIIKTAIQASLDGDVIDGYFNHTLDNGNVAILEVDNTVELIKGGLSPNLADNLPVVNAALSNYTGKISFPRGVFDLSARLIITRPVILEGQGASSDNSGTRLNFASSSGIVVEPSVTVTNIEIRGLLLDGGNNGTGLLLAGSLDAAVNDATFEDLRIQNFNTGLSTTYTISCLFNNIRLQACTKSFQLGSQTNNCVFNVFNPVTATSPSTFSNCEGIVINGFNCSNQSGGFAFTLFQSYVTINSPYFENVPDTCALVGGSSETNPSTLNINGGILSGDFVLAGKEPQLYIEGGRTNSTKTKIRTTSIVPVVPVGEIRASFSATSGNKESYSSIPILSMTSKKPIFPNGSSGGSIRYLRSGREYFEIEQQAASNGFEITSDLVVGKQYTLILSCRTDDAISASMGGTNISFPIETIPSTAKEFEKRIIPFVATGNVLDFLIVGTLQVKEISIYEGVTPNEGGVNNILDDWRYSSTPDIGYWYVGDRILNTSPAIGQPQGWVCTVEGNTGTWVAMPNLT